MTNSEKWIIVSQLPIGQTIGNFRSVIDPTMPHKHRVFYKHVLIAWQHHYGKARGIGNLVIGLNCTDDIVNELAELLHIG